VSAAARAAAQRLFLRPIAARAARAGDRAV